MVCAGVLFLARGVFAESESSLFWPAPPDEIRVGFVKSIYTAKDWGIKPTLFKKLKRLISGQENDAMALPTAIAVDRQGAVYVCDPGGSAVHVFDRVAKQYKKITRVGKQALVSPVGVAVDKAGSIFISDSKLGKVFCLTREGRMEYAVGGDQLFQRPTGLAVGDGRLFVVETAAHRVLIFDAAGHLLKSFGQRGKGPGEFNYPTAVALDKEGRVYVVDTLNFRIQVFDQEARFLYSVGGVGDGSGYFSRPKGVSVDSFGHIYVTDGLSDNVQIFSQKQEFLLSWGESGPKDGEFWIVSGIAVDEGNNIYVADSYNHRIQVFRYLGKD